jgi:general secretion pathway protein J
MTRASRRGFTLIEVLIALTIVATLLVVMFAGLRVGLAAWQRGEERAEVLDRTRSLGQILAPTLNAAYPYQRPATAREPARLLFEGEAERVAFVTAAAPFATATPIAFTAVTFSLEPGSGLAIRQKPLPNDDAFELLPAVVVDVNVSAARFRYLRDSDRAWTDRWDAAVERSLPAAVEVTLTVIRGGRNVEQPPLVIVLPVTTP